MDCRFCSLAFIIICVGVCGSEPPKPPPAAAKPQVFTGEVVLLTDSKQKVGKRTLILKSTGESRYAIIEDAASRMLFLDARLRDRPVRLTALHSADGKGLQVLVVQTIKNGTIYDVDYWCEICQISHDCPGDCVCCGDPVEFRERPAR
jgi:hypothetical protein